MKKNEINLIVLSEKTDWNEDFYLKLDASGNLRLRGFADETRIPLQLQTENQSALFNKLRDFFSDELVNSRGIYRGIPDKKGWKEYTTILSNTTLSSEETVGFHFSGSSGFKNEREQKLFREFCSIHSFAKKETQFILNAACNWVETGIRPTRLPEGTIVHRANSLAVMPESRRNDVSEGLSKWFSMVVKRKKSRK